MPQTTRPASSRLRLARRASVLGACLAACAVSAQTTLVDSTFQTTLAGWHWTGGQYYLDNGVANNFNSTSSQYFTTAFESVTLADGDTLSVSFNYNPASTNIRSVDVGFFSGTPATGRGAAEWDQWAANSPANTWRGFYGTLRTSAGNNEIFERSGPNDTTPFFNGISRASATSSLSTGAMRAAQFTLFNNNGTIEITLSEGADFGSLTSLVAASIADGQTSFNILSFYMRTTGGNGTIQYDNVSVVYTAAIPEPSAFAALAGVAALALVGARRRRRTA